MSIFLSKLLGRCIQTGIIGVLISLVCLLIAWNTYRHEHIIYGFILGFCIGLVELYVLRRFKLKANLLKLFARLLLYSLTILVIVIFFGTVLLWFKGNDYNLEATEKDVMLTVVQSVVVAFSIGLFLQLEAIVGVRILSQYLLGRYIRPKEERRFFMFIDLNDSTSINERIGNRAYYKLLNDFFRDLSLPVFESDAQIYKYVGDEIILSWPFKKGVKNSNCLKLYFNFLFNIYKNRHLYVEKYGFMPTFKAALHVGEVIVAQVGDLKKEIAFNGDALNTCAKIMEHCKPFGQGFLISEECFLTLDHISSYNFQLYPNVKLSGKEDEYNLYAVLRK
ncbi:adenylate/guanylate cyclase domain-containing protein [Luteibaculum oceani]|uniref:Adenylate/guanylate cyclase domain-containing protein n=1 Tax=Luteibaculum oceani TaxID=1294296 RepID=A0A5C6VL97_9FLAO|nr:adenylate/guanylate cyclase domain-containing protein [Luteibaculum oceani]TXC85166.1 adenylate/guanylate cyclase domain-containing protein [Luteibaculum oceani]